MTSDTPDMDDDIKLMLARAFDSAWERFIEREGADADTDDNRKRLARRIVAEAKAGDIDEEQLSESGLIYLCVLAEAARLGNGNHGNGGIGLHAFGDHNGCGASRNGVGDEGAAVGLRARQGDEEGKEVERRPAC